MFKWIKKLFTPKRETITFTIRTSPTSSTDDEFKQRLASRKNTFACYDVSTDGTDATTEMRFHFDSATSNDSFDGTSHFYKPVSGGGFAGSFTSYPANFPEELIIKPLSGGRGSIYRLHHPTDEELLARHLAAREAIQKLWDGE
jgi:hypothetical protein